MLSSSRVLATRAVAAAARPAVPARSLHAAPARFGGHGPSHGHAHAAHPVDPAMELPWKFGEHPLKKRVRENWEVIWWGGWGACAAISVFVAVYGPNSSLTHWAREEALHSGFKVPEVQPDLED